MMNDDAFLTRVRDAARALQYSPADMALNRVSARIRERLARPTVAELLARWFRPVAASVTAVAIVASLALNLFERESETLAFDEPIEISMAGDSYSVE